MTKGTFVHPETLIAKANTLVRFHGGIDAKPPNDHPVPRRTPPDGVGDFHINFGGEYSPNTNATYVEIYQGGKRVDNEIRNGKKVFEAKFYAGRENDPHTLILKFSPDNDWRQGFLKLDNLKPNG